MSENVIYSINGPVVKVKNAKDFSMLEMVYVGHAKLMGEVISISKDLTTIQVYETTTGLKPGEPVISTGSPICVTLGPGILRNIFDGIERPLKAIADQLKADMIIRAPHPIECQAHREYSQIMVVMATGITQTKTQSNCH